MVNLKLKTIHAELNAMLHCIHIFKNTCEDTMQVKRDIHVRQIILLKHILRIHVLVLSLHIICCNCCLFSNNYKNYMHGFDPYIAFYQRCICATVLSARTHRVTLRSVIYRGREETFIIVFNLKIAVALSGRYINKRKTIILFCING